MGETNRAINYMDLTEERREYLFKMPDFIESWLKDRLLHHSDIVIVRLIFNVSITVIPSAILLFYLQTPPFWLGIFHLGLIFVLYEQRFILTLHFASHKSVFNSKWFDNYLQYIVSPFFGIPCGAYRAHHVVMHHVENNVFPYDVSSTMTYQRDNVYHFLCYWLRYLFAIWFQLPYYAYKRQRYTLLFHTVMWCSIFLMSVYVLYKVAPVATMWVFILPYFVTSFLLMFGNWSQHIFIDPARYSDSYTITYNLINTPMNKLTYNDGYHIVHHLNSQLHWSQLPIYFNDNMNKFLEKDSLTFEGLEYVQIGFYVVLGKLDTLAKYYVHLGTPDTKKSEQEIIQKLKAWLVPISPKEE